jgi:Tfp pilus assembly protein PilF
MPDWACAPAAAMIRAQAETWLRKALDQNPNNTIALYELAELSQIQGKTLQARAFPATLSQPTRPTPQSLWLGFTIESAPMETALMRESTAVCCHPVPEFRRSPTHQ